MRQTPTTCNIWAPTCVSVRIAAIQHLSRARVAKALCRFPTDHALERRAKQTSHGPSELMEPLFQHADMLTAMMALVLLFSFRFEQRNSLQTSSFLEGRQALVQGALNSSSQEKGIANQHQQWHRMLARKKEVFRIPQTFCHSSSF